MAAYLGFKFRGDASEKVAHGVLVHGLARERRAQGEPSQGVGSHQ